MRMEYRRNYEVRPAKKGGLDLRLLKRLLGYMGPYRRFLFGAIVLLVVSKGLEAYVPIYIGEVTQSILSKTSLSEGEKFEAFSKVFYQSLAIFSLIALAYILDGVNVIVKNWIGQKSLFRLRMDVYAHIQSMPLGFFNKTAVGTLMTRTIHDVEQVNQLFSESIVPLTGSLILFIFVGAGLLFYDLRAAAVLFIILPVVFLLTNFFRVNQRRCFDKIRAIVSEMNAFVQEHLMGASTIRSFGLENEERRHFGEINYDLRSANIETIHYFALFFAGIDLIQSLSLVSIFAMLVAFPGAIAGFDAGTYFTFSLYILILFRPLSDLAERYNLLQSAIAAADRIFRVLDEKTEGFNEKGIPFQGGIESIEFNDVWFAYKGENWVLKGLTFALNKGESVALVGLTGAGKTTVMNLLLRFFEHQKGEIKINGIEIKHYSLSDLRGQFSVVLQDPEIFSGSLRENISLGNPRVQEKEIQEAIEFVNLSPLVSGFANGLDHILSERGKSLSAGQRQLVSLARAVANRRSGFILDEATANIDSMTEKTIQQVLKKLLHEKTSIIIAHRLSTIKDVDRIFVLHEGRVKEAGSHQELLQAGGIYEKLYRLQFLDEI